MSGFLDDFMDGKKTPEEEALHAELSAAKKRDVLRLADGYADEPCEHDEHDHDHGGACGTSGGCGGGGCGGGGCGGSGGCGG